MTVPQRVNVLVSSAGRRVVLQRLLRESLEEVGVEGEVFAADSQRQSAAFHLADRSFVVPRCLHDDFVPHMLALCAAHDVRLVIPTIDTELAVYAAAREQFAAIGVTVVVSSLPAVEIASDKAATNCWLRGQGLPATAQLSYDEAVVHLARPDTALVVKPRRGSSSEGVRIVHSLDSLSAAWGPTAVAERLAPGEEYTVDVLVGRDGHARCAVPRRRLQVRGGEVSKAVVHRAAVLMDMASRVCSALPGAYGVLNVQMFFDEPTGSIEIIEINPRFGGGFPLTHEAGGRYPTWLLEEELGLPSTIAQAKWKDDLVMLRYDEAVYLDAASAGIDGS